MCGIAGILAFNERSKQQLTNINAAVSELKKRGPDSEGIYLHANCALGHRRLSVIDTSLNASQPFTDKLKRYTIVFNGEIFNYKELRKTLASKGVPLVSQSDTEVILYLFILEKEKCVEKLDGEFAFVIYDKEKQELFAARDRYGIKPLYYYFDNNIFAFASELKALMKFDIPKQLDETSLKIYFELNYIPAPFSILKNVLKLESGSYMRINSLAEQTKEFYYQLNQNPQSRFKGSYLDAQSKLKSLMEQSVTNRMIADVPLGTFLSGGIDSSIITAIAAQHTPHLKTFSIGYKDEPYFDETKYANLVAKMYHTEHTVFSLSNDDLFQNLNSVLEYTDEPFADSSALAVNILSMHTRKEVTVALSGDGADELFGGYNKHSAELKARSSKFSNNVFALAAPIINRIPKSRNSKAGNTFRQLSKYANGIKLSNAGRYWLWAGFGENNLLLSKYKNDKEYLERRNNIIQFINDDFNSVLYTDMKLVLENDMLVKVDRMSMSNSLEVRVPFLDNKIVDFAFSLPVEFKIDFKQRKKILKDAFRTSLPPEIYHRKKQGFEVPLLKWFQTDLKTMIADDLLSDSFIENQGIFELQEIKNLKSQLFSSNPDEVVAKVWALLVFQYWWKKYFN